MPAQTVDATGRMPTGRLPGGALLPGRTGRKKCANARQRVKNRRRKERHNKIFPWMRRAPMLNDGNGGNDRPNTRRPGVKLSYANAVGGKAVPENWHGRGKFSLPEHQFAAFRERPK